MNDDMGSRSKLQQARFRLGYWLAEKKIRKLSFEDFETTCRNAGIDLVKIDLDQALESQGPFDIIIHKLTDQIARSQTGCTDAQLQIDRFQDYVASNSDVIVVDPLDRVMKLFDRHQQYILVKHCLAADGIKDCHCFAPSFVELTSASVDDNVAAIHQHGLQFPLVCKPSASHGSSQCHQMSIVFNEAGLKEVEYPCLAQTFVNHNARLFKIFVMGRKQFIVERPSIKNFEAGDYETIFFNSNDVSKPYASSFLTKMPASELVEPVFEADEAKLNVLTVRLQETFQLDLFGIDVIIENCTGRYAIIDINTFPGYEDVPDFFENLLSFLQQKLAYKFDQLSD